VKNALKVFNVVYCKENINAQVLCYLIAARVLPILHAVLSSAQYPQITFYAMLEVIDFITAAVKTVVQIQWKQHLLDLQNNYPQR
jgi:hypothetical protein